MSDENEKLKQVNIIESDLRKQAVDDVKELEALCRELVQALKAQIKMRDYARPTKLVEEMSWRENDELANNMAEESLTKFQARFGGK